MSAKKDYNWTPVQADPIMNKAIELHNMFWERMNELEDYSDADSADSPLRNEYECLDAAESALQAVMHLLRLK